MAFPNRRTLLQVEFPRSRLKLEVYCAWFFKKEVPLGPNLSKKRRIHNWTGIGVVIVMLAQRFPQLTQDGALDLDLYLSIVRYWAQMARPFYWHICYSLEAGLWLPRKAWPWARQPSGAEIIPDGVHRWCLLTVSPAVGAKSPSLQGDLDHRLQCLLQKP